MYWKTPPEYSLYLYVCTDSHDQNPSIQASFHLFTLDLHHLSLRRCVCLSWPVRFLPSLPSLLSTVSINHQPLPGLRLILTIWRFYYWKIDQKSAKIIVLRQYFCLLFVATFIALQLIIHFGWYLSGNVSSFGKFIEHSFSSSVKSGPDFFCFLKTFSNNNSKGLGCSPDLGKSRCPYFSCEIKTIHRRKKQC